MSVENDQHLTKCHYCQKPMGDEYHCVIKSNQLVMAHKSCHARSQAGSSNIRIIVKSGGGCVGGTCRR